MCRLYGFRTTEPTEVACTLVHAQNAITVQSRQDLKGYNHATEPITHEGWQEVPDRSALRVTDDLRLEGAPLSEPAAASGQAVEA